jgi:Putative Ig domain
MQMRAFLVWVVLATGYLVVPFGNWTGRNTFLHGDSDNWENSAPVSLNRVQVPSRRWPYSAVLTTVGSQPRYQSHPAPVELPTRLTLPAANGQISGTAPQEDQQKARLTATDAKGVSGSNNLPTQAMRGTLDQYGGSTQAKCTKSTGYFHLEKIENRWWFCTPQGNVFWMVGMFDMGSDTHTTDLGTSYGVIAKRKYGDLDMTWGPQQVRRIKSWGFNSVAEFTTGWTWPIWTCGASTCPSEWIKNGGKQPVPVPMIVQVQPAVYSLSNLYNYAPGAVKDTMYGVNMSHWRGYVSVFPDVFDPNFGLWLEGEMTKDRIITSAENSPWVIAWITDECDELNGLCGAGPDFPTNPPGHNQRNQGLVTLITSPVQTIHPMGGLVRSFEAYENPVVLSKEQLRAYLNKKYGGIAALNVAWGSHYTTFGTTGTQITGEKIGAGNGVTREYTATLLHPKVSAYSVALKVGGKLVGGDCPAWVGEPVCAAGGTGAGKLIGDPSSKPVVQAGTIQYTSGKIAITFVSPPAQGAEISVEYIYEGWGYGTGLLDEDGRNSWIPSDPVRLGANAEFNADMDGFLYELAKGYFSIVTSVVRKHAPHNLVFGPGVLGTWNGVADKNVLEAAAPYVDGIGTTIDYTRTQVELSYIATYLGDKPMIIWHGAHANADSALWRYANSIDTPCNPCSTQKDRAEFYTNAVNSFLNTTNTVYNDYTIVGFRWWGYLDSRAEKENWGLVSLQDNPYDGVSAAVAPGADPWGYPTGGEEKNYGNFLDAVRAANLSWLKIP